MTVQERIQELSRLEEFFKTAQKPIGPIVIGGFMRLNSIQTFIDTNITRVKGSIDNISSEPCILRLQQLEGYLTELQVAIAS